MFDQNVNEVAPVTRGMTPFKRTLAALSVGVNCDIAGNYFHVLTAPVNDLQVSFDAGEPVPCYEGVGFARNYKSFTLSSATGQAVIVLAGFGSVQDGRSKANVTTTVNISPGANLNDGGDVSCTANAATQLLAQDTNRLYALITNASANTIIVRIGTSAVTAAKGTPVEPGQTLPLATTAAIYAFNTDATNAVTISASSVKV